MDLNYPDQVVSVFAAAAIAAALRSATRSGIGAHLDISQRELASYLVAEQVAGGADVRDVSRLGNASPEYLLQDAFAARDGWVAVSIEDETQLTGALGLAVPDMTASRDLDIAAFRQIFADWVAAQSAGSVCDLLRGHSIAAAPVLDGQGAWHHAASASHDSIRPLARSPAGDVVKGFPLHFPQQPIAVNCAAPDLGQHTETVLRDILGLQADDIAALARDNVIGTRPASPNASRLD
jgi:crotonobetainyl-CoA:carnitine CoA-transferase CaiB-like acyl-CoA transferase